MSLVGMLMGDASYMEKVIQNWKIPEDHNGHTAELQVGFYIGSGEYSINYVCDCGKKNWNIGEADPDLISDSIWSKNAKKQ